MKQLIILLSILSVLCLCSFVSSGSIKRLQLGLYSPNDKVNILDNDNFGKLVLQQNRSSLVEFYNSYCGHCKRFAPIYKRMAANLYPWNNTLLIAAIDCAAEENNSICREYEIMGYPTIRYFTANFTPTPNNYGRDIDTQIPKEIRQQVAIWLANDYEYLHPLKEANQVSHIFDDNNSTQLYKIIVYDSENKTIGIQVALFLQKYHKLQVSYTVDAKIAQLFDLDSNTCMSVIGDQNVSRIKCSDLDKENPGPYVSAIKDVLIKLNFIFPSTSENTNENTAIAIMDINTVAIVERVQKEMHLVYQADLEMAVRAMLFNEIPRIGNISGERLLALKRIMAILHMYQPLSRNGHGNDLIKHMNFYVSRIDHNLTGQEFSEEIERTEKNLNQPIFLAKNYVGCIGSQPNYRGFTCSLWQLFHHLTVQALLHGENVDDKNQVLEAIHGYVKYFFGCTECSEHFQVIKQVLLTMNIHSGIEKKKGKEKEKLYKTFRKVEWPSKE